MATGIKGLDYSPSADILCDFETVTQTLDFSSVRGSDYWYKSPMQKNSKLIYEDTLPSRRGDTNPTPQVWAAHSDFLPKGQYKIVNGKEWPYSREIWQPLPQPMMMVNINSGKSC